MSRLLVIGTRFGATYLDAVKHSKNWEIAGIVAKTKESLEEAGKKFSVDKANLYTSVDDALKRCNNIDAAVVAVPNEMHYPIACKVLDAGLNLILEKPITETWDQAIDLVRRLDKHPGKKAMVGQTLRGDMNLRMMEYHLARGIVGRIEQILFEAHWNWVVPDPANPRNWRFRLPDMFLDDIGIHEIDTIRMIAGNKACKELVAATWSPPSYPIKAIAGTSASSTWVLDEDVRVSYFGSMSCKGHDIGWYGRVHVFGEKGCLFRESEGQPYFYEEGKKPVGLDDAYGENVDEYLPLVDVQKIPYLLEDFYHAIEQDRPPVTDLHDNINSHAILLAMKQSAREKRWIDVQATFPRTGVH
ncbi:MAG: Gfo/Idh/MocA family oxidoreductase [Candidatus Lokiarchaeota archaeon]|nr:Gfo/Idh/MocA family oxidoreductase [Candidatus Lokiarchaeota archaeon]